MNVGYTPPDVVILKGVEFIDELLIKKEDDTEKKRLLGEFVLALREDLIQNPTLKKTELKSTDFRVVAA